MYNSSEKQPHCQIKPIGNNKHLWILRNETVQLISFTHKKRNCNVLKKQTKMKR